MSVLLDESGRCMIPPEALSRPMRHLMAGVWGVREGRVVLPTVWADLGVVLPGAAPGPDVTPPTPELWRQELAGKGDRLQYTLDGGLGLYAGERLLASVPVRVDGADGIPALRVGRGLRIEDGLVWMEDINSLFPYFSWITSNKYMKGFSINGVEVFDFRTLPDASRIRGEIITTRGYLFRG